MYAHVFICIIMYVARHGKIGLIYVHKNSNPFRLDSQYPANVTSSYLYSWSVEAREKLLVRYVSSAN